MKNPNPNGSPIIIACEGWMKWEYKRLDLEGEISQIERELNKLGSEGWELVSMRFGSFYEKVVLKRISYR